VSIFFRGFFLFSNHDRSCQILDDVM
jgi:hypothetical protein